MKKKTMRVRKNTAEKNQCVREPAASRLEEVRDWHGFFAHDGTLLPKSCEANQSEVTVSLKVSTNTSDFFLL